MDMQNITNIVYLIAAVLFILDLKMLAHPRTAVRGNQLGALAMALAVVATLASGKWDWTYIILGIGIDDGIVFLCELPPRRAHRPVALGTRHADLRRPGVHSDHASHDDAGSRPS